MAKYKSRSTTEVITVNKTLINDRFTSIFLKNQGEGDVRVFDNILLVPGESFSWNNEPDVVITDNVQIAFSSVGVDNRILVMKIYTEEV